MQSEVLNDFPRKRVDLEDKPHDFREQLSIMDSRTLSHIHLLIFGDTI